MPDAVRPHLNWKTPADSMSLHIGLGVFAYAYDKANRLANRSAKLKQCKLDARREQWLSQGGSSSSSSSSSGGCCSGSMTEEDDEGDSMTA
ncbi:hypothetical protein HAX54_050950 [Datura stramonium]|uniref:Uncharacterized protein n=1 Tax=Datura stramonium TaxID=4076 RepID=A0ABS8WLW9_DATST|nr:hypothetical protein [Datura stramonium]